MKMRKLSYLVSIAGVVACASSAYAASKPKAISYQDASEFERSLLARTAVLPPPPEKLYVQQRLSGVRHVVEREQIRLLHRLANRGRACGSGLRDDT